MLLTVDSQLYGIENHHGNMSVGMPMRGFYIKLTDMGRAALTAVGTVLWAGILEAMKRRRRAEHKRLQLLSS